MLLLLLLCEAAGRVEVLRGLWDQWSDRKRSHAEGDDHTALRQDHLSTGNLHTPHQMSGFPRSWRTWQNEGVLMWPGKVMQHSVSVRNAKYTVKNCSRISVDGVSVITRALWYSRGSWWFIGRFWWSLSEASESWRSVTDVFVFQRAAFAHFPELNDFALSNVAAVDTRESLTKHFGHLR